MAQRAPLTPNSMPSGALGNLKELCHHVPMGYLQYGNGSEYEIEDRALAHLKVAVGQKLRRQECFFVSWTNSVEKGSGRISLWVSPNIPLVFRFSGSRVPDLNSVWLDVLRDLSHTPRGMVLVTEDEAEAYARQHGMVQ